MTILQDELGVTANLRLRGTQGWSECHDEQEQRLSDLP
jgi:hypothetical protein